MGYLSAEVKSMKEWALYYAELGLAVFPLAYRNKVPAIEGGNTFITESIPANTKVSAKSPELVIKKPKAQVSATNVWEY